MADIVPPEMRSRMMAGIRGKNTGIEMTLRRGLHGMGFRFRLHDRRLPGRPDLVFPRRRAVLFAHGCFWHGHNCHLFRLPATRTEFWREKISGNQKRDAANESAAADLGWRVGIVWECAIRGRAALPKGQVLGSCAAWLQSDEPGIVVRGRE